MGSWCNQSTKANVYRARPRYRRRCLRRWRRRRLRTRGRGSRVLRRWQTQPLPGEDGEVVPHVAEKGVETDGCGEGDFDGSRKAGDVSIPSRADFVRQPATAAEKAEKILVRAGDGSGLSFMIAISIPMTRCRLAADARIVITLTNLAEHQILFAHKPGKENAEVLVRDWGGSESGGEGRAGDGVWPGVAYLS